MEAPDRIEQWEKMTREDPSNDMGWFSLGNAYRDAGRLEDADKALAQCLTLNPGLSRAYQLRAQVLIQLHRPPEAAEVLKKGYVVAAQRGDTMPQRAMAALLEKLGQPVPQVTPGSSGGGAGAGGAAEGAGPVLAEDAIVDRKTGRPGTRMKEPPFRGALGRFIMEHFSQETWREWIHMGTKVINELRLDFSNDAHARMYDQHMMEWLGITEEEVRQYTEKFGQAATAGGAAETKKAGEQESTK